MSRSQVRNVFPPRLSSTGSDGAAGDEEGGRTQFAIFATLLAIAVLFDRASLSDWEVVSTDTAVSLVAIFVLLRPASVPRLVALLVAQLVHATIDSPLMTNHWTLVALASLAILINLAVAAIRRQDWLADPGAVYRRIAPALRIQVVALYLIAGFAKMNAGFFDPALSCGATLARDLFNRGPWDLAANWQTWPAIVGTVVFEVTLPIMLLTRRTRLVAVFVGATFHTLLAVAGHVAFSGFAMAFYVLFLPDDLPTRLRRLSAESRLRVPAERLVAFASQPAAFAVLGGAWVLVAIAVSYGPDGVLSAVDLGTLAVFLIYVVLLAVGLVRALADDVPPVYRRGHFSLAHPSWALGLVLVVLLALSPYTGLRTQDTFTMYSNLQTEDGRWNHAVLPEAVRIFPLQDDLVRIVASSDALLARNARTATRLVWWDFRRHASAHPEASVTYERRGTRHMIARIGDDPTLSRRPNAIVQKLLMFRDVPPARANSCRADRDYDYRNGS